jgi:hypothetical protein
MGWVYLYLGRYNSAEAEFKRAIELMEIENLSVSVNIAMAPERGIEKVHDMVK